MSELNRNEIRAFIFEIIDDMSDTEMRQLLKDLRIGESPKMKRESIPGDRL